MFSIKFLLISLSVFLLTISFAYGEECRINNQSPESVVEFWLYDASMPFAALHYFNLDDADKAKEVLEIQLATIANGLDELLVFHRACLSEEEIEEIYRFYRRLAAMNEIFPMESINDNKTALFRIDEAIRLNNIEMNKERKKISDAYK